MSDLIRRPLGGGIDFNLLMAIRDGIANPLGITNVDISRGHRPGRHSTSIVIDGRGQDGRDISIEFGMQGSLAINGQWSGVRRTDGTPPALVRDYPEGVSSEQRAFFDRAADLASRVLPNFRPAADAQTPRHFRSVDPVTGTQRLTL